MSLQGVEMKKPRINAGFSKQWARKEQKHQQNQREKRTFIFPMVRKAMRRPKISPISLNSSRSGPGFRRPFAQRLLHSRGAGES